MSSFLPTIGVTLNVMLAGFAYGFTMACDVPLPAMEPLQAAFGLARMASSDFVHCFRPLVESLSVDGNVILIVLAVALLSDTLFVTFSLNVVAFGFFFVPAVVGATLASTVNCGGAVGVWA